MGKNKIEATTGYWLTRLSRAHRYQLQQRLSVLGLYPGQELLLMQLWTRDGQTQSELAQHLGIQQATLTRMIDRMTQSGLLSRKPDPVDGRISRVHLTPASEKLRGPVEKIWQQLERQIFSKLSLEERLLLRRLLKEIHEDLISD
jgi:DNA-binding MarR family transcriptional regulator